ncbi:MAG: amino acid adenylation domain-containing protein, partial [Gemmatimonadota bacterium]
NTDYLPFGPEERIAQVSNLAFDAATFELWGALLGGGSVVVIEREVLLSPARFAAELRERGVTAMFLTAALFNRVAREEPGAFRTCRHVLVGGEALDAQSLRRVLEAGPPRRLLNGYGPTETTTFAAWHEIREVAPGAATVPIGRALRNTTLHVLDVAGGQVPVGVPGELHVGGPGVARGYLGRADLTAERFVPDGHGGAGGRLYRTGDRVRRLDTGELEYLGRLDAQVKIRGFRIEPGEVEAVLLEQDDVREAAVVAREDAPGEKRLVAYLAPADGSGAVPAGLRARLAERLPDYMVPSAFVALERLPLNANGKLDRRALPAPERESAQHVAPRTAAEEVLAGIWAEVLGTDRVGVEEDFFGLGGHSLLATQVVSRVRQAFGVELPLRALFEAPTVAGLAGRVEEMRGTGAAPTPPIERVPRDGPLPLSFAQQRLWLVDRLEPGNAAYNIPFALRLRGRPDVPALRAGLDELVRRHETLRTTFAERPDGPVQVVHPPARVPLPVADLGGLPGAERESRAGRLAAEEALRPFDLARGPLLRGTLLRLGEDDHVLCFTLHHVVGDGWSTGVLVREVSALYAAFSRGETPRLPELPVQYADYAAWQRGWLRGEALEAQIAYWRERLEGAPPLLGLPTDRPRPQVQGGAGASLRFVVPAGTTRGLRRLARREGATLFMTALAAWQLLLSRYSRQDDVSVGTPVAGRTRAEVEGLVGFFVNMLVVRTDLSGEPTFRELLERVREGALGAFAHQEIPFEKLVEALQPERGPGHDPFFQVVFALHAREQGEGLRLGDLGMEPLGGELRAAKFDVETTLVERDDRLDASLVYRTELWDEATIERLLEHFGVLLESVASDPERSASTLPLLRETERTELLALGSARESYPVEETLHGLFEAQARRRPRAVAVSGDGERMVYAELEARSAQLACYLAAQGVGPGARVAIFCERTPELLVAILGTLRAGGAYVPLDPAYPSERLAFMLEDAGVRVVLTQYELRRKLPATGCPVLELDTEWGQVERARSAPVARAAPEDAAYVIYTSGSTGRPKGVEVEHRQVVRLLRSTERWFGFGEDDVWTLFHSYAFDFSVWEIWGALLHGGKLVVVPYLTSRDPEAFHALLRRERVTVLSQTPSAFRQLVTADRTSPGIGTLRYVVLGGEALDPAALAPWGERYGYECPVLVNMYGITETTVHVTHRVIRREDVERGWRSPIGVALPDLSLHVLERSGEPAPVGVPGELHVGGAGLARGYLNLPELSAQRFVPDPFAGEAGARLYRSGDLARRLPGGELEYLGRIDEQVKVRGFRIELGEIEAALCRHPGVLEAVVLAREDRPGEKRLVGYAVGEGVSAEEVREHLRRALPEYMVPEAVVLLEELPLTTNGKLDRRRLPAPEVAGSAERSHAPPETEVERALAQIWSEVLGVERVGREDEFFGLGGHSLRATQVVARVRTQLGVEMPLRLLFEGATLGEIAPVVERLRDEAGGAGGEPIARVGRDGPLPLSFAQQRLWLMDRLEPGSAAYNVPFALRLRGRPDVPALRAGLDELVRRHETLRTTFAERPDGPVQVVHPPARVPLPVADLGGLPGAER